MASQKNYLRSADHFMHQSGDKKVHHYFFFKCCYHGCNTQPDVAEHKEIADELMAYVRELMK